MPWPREKNALFGLLNTIPEHWKRIHVSTLVDAKHAVRAVGDRPKSGLPGTFLH